MPKNAKEISHQAIVEAAWLLAKTEGISSLTMMKVAKAAGLTRQAIYWHFKSRTNLLLSRHAIAGCRYPVQWPPGAFGG
jgi:TetR/AcrR family acrAB operon transcriptional repressor